jgi:hypothetical protein
VTSREKVLALKGWLLSQRPEDEETAQQLQLAASFAPLFVKLLPTDPEEVDRYLRLCAAAAARCRSDDAAPIGVFELVDGEWQEVQLFEEADA